MICLQQNHHNFRGDLSKVLNVKEDAIQYYLNQLKQSGRIIRHGPDKGGYWQNAKQFHKADKIHFLFFLLIENEKAMKQKC